MWLKHSESKATDGIPATEGSATLIGPGARFSGMLVGHVDVRIAGELVGVVRGRTITVGANAAVDAVLKGYVIDIAGAVYGRVEAITVNVLATATIDATIFHHKLSIEKGAIINGLRPWRPVADMALRIERAD